MTITEQINKAINEELGNITESLDAILRHAKEGYEREQIVEEIETLLEAIG